jgi:hypothetical protein
MVRDEEGIFCLKIDYEPHSADPARVFRTMTGLLESLDEIDNSLATSISASLRTTLLLEEIDTGSLRAWIRSAIESVDDDAIKDLSLKKAIGAYLVRGKRAVLRKMAAKSTITDRQEIRLLQAELSVLAEDTQVGRLPTYEAVPPAKLLNGIRDISEALQNLDDGDHVVYISDAGEEPLNRAFRLSEEAVENILTAETITSDSVMILKVKKPDFLGSSMWEFRHQNRSIEAKIIDGHWLSRFQARLEKIQPGDSLRVKIRADARYSLDGECIAVHHTITQVLEVLEAPRYKQGNLLSPPSSESSGEGVT